MIDLAQIHPFSDLPPAHSQLLERVMAVHERRAGHVFVRQGDQASAVTSAMWVLLDGEVRVTTTRAGRPALDRRLQRGAIFGTVGFLDDGTRTATCTAATGVRVAQLDRVTFGAIFQTHHAACASFQLLIARQLVADVRELDRQLKSVLGER